MANKEISKSKVDMSLLEAEYKNNAPLAMRFIDELCHQLTQLLDNELIFLSFPIQHRLKSWQSISAKLEKKSVALDKITDLSDLAGLRIILQFRRDIEKVCRLINANFKVVEQYDTLERLKEDQFGYSSIHFIVELPEKWLTIPTLSKMSGLRAEIQVRTTAQHIWATASHTLQYKYEESVPPTIRRAIYRVSALLETVDLEFERVLGERETYREEALDISSSELLNVDLLGKILDEVLPEQNKGPDEPYAELLEDLMLFKIDTPKLLVDLITKHKAEILEDDAKRAKDELSSPENSDAEKARLLKGAYYLHVGLVRRALFFCFGDKWTDYITAKFRERQKKNK